MLTSKQEASIMLKSPKNSSPTLLFSISFIPLQLMSWGLQEASWWPPALEFLEFLNWHPSSQ